MGDKEIVGVIPGDYDGDMTLDLIVIVKNSQKYDLHVSWGQREVNGDMILEEPQLIAQGKSLDSQPTVLDYDGNTVPDFLVQKNGKIERLFVENLSETG